MDAALYLRKSRMEEGMETEEVLSRHQKALLDFAAKQEIQITERYCEVVSGESLYARPEMLRLLEAVEEGRFDAVLVMDLDRLSRGRMKDQGIILDAFRDSETLIITPDKTYNLADDIDDELAEFKTFMSRREYKIINKRLRRGVLQSVHAGCYVSNPPYGYRRAFVDKRPTLEVLEEEALFVRMMYDLYLQGLGCTSIARQVNLLGARPHRTDRFSRSSVLAILRNPTYIGKVVWNQKKHSKKDKGGTQQHEAQRQPRESWTIVDGLHPHIVSQETYDRVQAMMEGRYTPPKQDGRVKNPLASLVRCQNCGRNLQRINMQGTAYLICVEPGCCAATKFDLVEARILQHLQEQLQTLQVEPEALPPSDANRRSQETLSAIRRELSAIQGQKLRLHDLLELGEYDLCTFRERLSLLNEKYAQLKALEASATVNAGPETGDEAKQQSGAISLLAVYQAAGAAERRALLHSIVDVIWYHKPKKSKPAAFSLRILLKPF